MADMFAIGVDTIGRHIRNISEEWNEKPVIAYYPITGDDGKQYNVMHYNHEVTYYSG